MLLMQNPALLLVDEPVAGMTPHEIERTAVLLQSLAGEHFRGRGRTRHAFRAFYRQARYCAARRQW